MPKKTRKAHMRDLVRESIEKDKALLPDEPEEKGNTLSKWSKIIVKKPQKTDDGFAALAEGIMYGARKAPKEETPLELAQRLLLGMSDADLRLLALAVNTEQNERVRTAKRAKDQATPKTKPAKAATLPRPPARK